MKETIWFYWIYLYAFDEHGYVRLPLSAVTFSFASFLSRIFSVWSKSYFYDHCESKKVLYGQFFSKWFNHNLIRQNMLRHNIWFSSLTILSLSHLCCLYSDHLHSGFYAFNLNIFSLNRDHLNILIGFVSDFPQIAIAYFYHYKCCITREMSLYKKISLQRPKDTRTRESMVHILYIITINAGWKQVNEARRIITLEVHC